MGEKATKLQTEFQQFAKSKLDEISTDLINSEKPVIDEKSFVTGYLNMFLQLVKEGPKGPTILSPAYKKWIDMTANGKLEAQVVDNNDHSKVLFLVPALYAGSDVDFDFIHSQFHTLSEIPSRMITEYNYTPAQGERYMARVINVFNQSIKASDDIKQRWIDIFNRYKHGYTIDNSGSKVTPNISNISKSSTVNETEDMW